MEYEISYILHKYQIALAISLRLRLISMHFAALCHVSDRIILNSWLWFPEDVEILFAS